LSAGTDAREVTRVKLRKKMFDYEYEEVLDVKTRELIRVACAVAVGCPD
jgi:alkylhydroperoxidase/carboxymuconolactone decarboxylase family protein YurZ